MSSSTHGFKVEIKRKRIYVNGKIIRPIDEDNGGYRLIGITKDGYVVKADFKQKTWGSPRFCSQTAAEIEMYRHIEKQDRKYFPRIVAHGTLIYRDQKYHWLIEEYQPLVFTYDWKLPDRIVDKLNDLSDKYGIFDLGIFSQCNWSRTISGRPVIFDFGCNYYSNW
jgi:hypothetical protein